jgi:hypothetical protein
MRCIVCGRPGVSHHAAGVVNLPGLTVPACGRHHARLDAALRHAGVPLSHDRTPTETEIVYALIAGVSSVYSLATAGVGEHGRERAAVVDRLAIHLRRLMLALLPTSGGRLGPEPVRRAGQDPGRRSRRVVSVADPVGQAGQLFTLVSQAAQAGLGQAPGERPYLQALQAASESSTGAVRWLDTIEHRLGDQLQRMNARILSAMGELVAATVALDLAAPTEAQLSGLAEAVSELALIERTLLRSLSALAAAQDEEQALALVDQLLDEVAS